MRKAIFTVCVLIPLLLTVSCTVGSDSGKPHVDSISPESTVSHMPEFMLTVKGSGFVQGAQIIIGGYGKETTFVKNTELTCRISPDDTRLDTGTTLLPESGLDTVRESKTVDVMVRNPAPERGDSNTKTITIVDNPEFQEARQLTEGYFSMNSSRIIADKEGNLNLVWRPYSQAEGVNDIFFQRSLDSGETWSVPVNVTNFQPDFPGKSYYTVMAMDDAGNISLAWHQWIENIEEIKYSRSTDGGETWSPPVLVTRNTERNLKQPAIAVDNEGSVYIAWTDDSHDFPEPGKWGEVYFSRSRDNGETWSPAINISNFPWMHSGNPDLAVDGDGNIIIAWVDFRYSGANVYLCRSTDGSESWSEPVNVSEASFFCDNFALALDPSGNPHVIWFNFGRERLYYRGSDDKGVTCGEMIALSEHQDDNTISGLDIAVDSAGNIDVVWQDRIVHQIVFRRSTDNGITWKEQVTASIGGRVPLFPDLAVDASGKIYVVWADRGIENADYYLFFSRGN